MSASTFLQKKVYCLLFANKFRKWSVKRMHYSLCSIWNFSLPKLIDRNNKISLVVSVYYMQINLMGETLIYKGSFPEFPYNSFSTGGRVFLRINSTWSKVLTFIIETSSIIKHCVWKILFLISTYRSSVFIKWINSSLEYLQSKIPHHLFKVHDLSSYAQVAMPVEQVRAYLISSLSSSIQELCIVKVLPDPACPVNTTLCPCLINSTAKIWSTLMTLQFPAVLSM